MIHTKSLLRRLAFVPWLLALGLVVGWTGTADAQTAISLELGTKKVREDNGTTEISVTAKSADPTSGPVYVVLKFAADDDPLNQRFRMTVPTLIIPKADKADDAKVTGTITFIPVDDNLRGDDYQDNGAADDLDIVITGQAGPGYDVGTDTLTLIDNDKLTRNMNLKFDPGSLSKEAEATEVDVAVAIDGARFASNHSFDVVFKNTVGDDRNDLFDKTPKTFDDSENLNILVRDSDYRATSGKINLSRRKKEGSGTITLDPFNVDGHVAIEAAFQGGARFFPLSSEAEGGYPIDQARGDDNSWIIDDDENLPLQTRFIQSANQPGIINDDRRYHLIRAGSEFETPIGNTDAVYGVEASNFLVASGVDLNSDGDTGDVITLVNGFLTEKALGLDVDRSGGELADTTISGGDVSGSVSELDLGIDLNGDGLLTGAGRSEALLSNPAEASTTPKVLSTLVEKDLPFGIMVRAGFYQITDTDDQLVKEVKIAPAMMREEEGERTFDVTVTLARKRPEASRIRFEIEDQTEDTCDECAGVRDIDYTADIAPLTIPPQSDTGTTQLTVISVDNNIEDEAKIFKLLASLSNEKPAEASFTIADDELPTTEVTLSASPGEVTSGSGEQEVAIMATINGKVFDEDLKLTLILDHKRESGTRTTAERDIDFDASVAPLTIKAGAVTGSSTISIMGIPNATGDLTIGLTALEASRSNNVLSTKNEDEEDIKLNTVAITLKPAPVEETEEAELALADLSITKYTFTAGMSVSEVLPEATGGSGMLQYSLSSNLPAGLMFDSATRMLSGTPEAATDATELIYTVFDSEGTNAATLFTVEVGPAADPEVVVSSVELSQTSVREGSGTIEISVIARLAAEAPVAETIRFTLEASGAGKAAKRDVDFTASLVGNVPIEVGAMQATTTLTLTAVDNGDADGNRFLAVQASGSGGSASADIKIADDETASTAILLSASPNTVSEAAGETDITVTATLDGQVRSDATEVAVSIDPSSSATRDEDYAALFIGLDPIITIPANEVSGSVVLRIVPDPDGMDEGNESIMLVGMASGLASGSATVTLADYDEMMDGGMMMDPVAFAEGSMMIADIHATAGEPIDSMELPAAMGGSGEITYSVSDLPAGLMFDAATRMLSGTPEAAGTTEVTYMATDEAGDSVSMTFAVMVNPMLDFSDLGDGLFGALNGGAAGKANPASEHDSGTHWVVGQPIAAIHVPNDTILQQFGGTPPYTVSISGLPAGVSYDEATRTISGTPTEIGATVVTITITEANGGSASLPSFGISVVLPPLSAPSNLVAQDYTGADGQGDQGGFILLTWELSANHGDRDYPIDGYRIFRALPVLNNEMVPWAMVDAVPGVERGVAVVATLDNVATRWGIAAERGGQTTHSPAKAVFVSAENLNQPYAQMAETLMASKAAAQAGDGPVFASLLPEALAYAQGVAPKLKSVAGVESSALIVTDEPVRAIDNIAPLAVPSLSVLDAPNDEGSRIVLTWALSPSDRVLQDVVTEAIGPLGDGPVVGVYGYNIHRRAVGEDEFAVIAQVDAGVTSFVDETALNGVRYTYQVRPYDLDNEPMADIEHTAMAVRNLAMDSAGRAIFGLFGTDNRVGFDDFFIFADNFGLTAADAGFDPAFDLAPSEMIDFDDFFVFADNFGRSTAAAGKRVPLLAGLNADARLYLDARTGLPSVGEDFVLDVSMADFAAIKGYGLQVQYDADKLSFVEVLTDQPLGGSAFATPQVLADEAGVLTVAAHGDVVSEGELALSLVFRAQTEIEGTVVEITDNQTYDGALGFNRLALPAPVQLQTRPEAFALANNYPNPFNPATTIQYALPQAADVELTVYNVVGQVVRTLVAEHQSAGRYVVEWDATNDSGQGLSSGMYFYRLEAGGEFHEVKKMLLLK